MKKLKTLGLIGGMSWQSSAEYYRILNETVTGKLGEPHSCECVMYSFDFAEIEKLQHAGQWDELTNLMLDAAKRLERAGAELLLICTNTMHKMAEDIERNVSIPLLHIADATAEQIKQRGLKRVGLLGTRFTMEQDFYKDRIQKRHGIEVLIPTEEERQIIHDVIYNELVTGKISESSRQKYLAIIRNLVAAGAEGIILGCTEIPLLVRQSDCEVPLFDTTTIHAKAAVEMALG